MVRQLSLDPDETATTKVIKAQLDLYESIVKAVASVSAHLKLTDTTGATLTLLGVECSGRVIAHLLSYLHFGRYEDLLELVLKERHSPLQFVKTADRGVTWTPSR